jgi:hypothetical protein
MNRRTALAAIFLGSQSLSAQGTKRTLRIPFRSLNSMILLDAVVNGKPSVLVLDTGSRFTSTTQPTKHARIDLAGRTFEKNSIPMNLDTLSKWIGSRVDGLMGQDIFMEFSALRIDYKAGVVELEE